jgi:hypothetical protein
VLSELGDNESMESYMTQNDLSEQPPNGSSMINFSINARKLADKDLGPVNQSVSKTNKY